MTTKESTKTKIHTVYKNAKGERLPSVTTVLGILNKPALMDWAWKCGCEGKDYKAVRDEAAGIGTLAHYLVLCNIKGEKPDTSEYSAQDIERAENCLIKYWDWCKAHDDIKPVLVEKPLVSEQYGYGGTIDYLGQSGNELYLIDHKTGKGIYSEMFYQLAAYVQLLKEAGYNVSNARILRIGRDDVEGFEERVMNDLSKHFELFQHCLAVYRLQNELRRG